jgi:hypothetical protein
MTSHRPTPAILAVLAATAIGCAACAFPATSSGTPARRDTASHRPLAAAASPAVPLPVSQAGLRAAAALAARFAADYLTRPPGQSPGRWLARLAPMVTGQLYGTLARTAVTPALWPPGQPPATAAVAAVRVRDLAAGSVILTVTARVRQAGGAGTTTAGLAVTVVSGTAGWTVYDVEPATAGNTG